MMEHTPEWLYLKGGMSMIQMLTRLVNIKLPKGQSAFLWGPRKTGKTTFLRAAFPESLRYDLLQTDIFLEFVKRPFLLR